MDFSMFDDDAEDIGQEIEAYCARCKADTPHTIVSRYEDEIRRVKCNTCEDIHAFRKPRGEDMGDEPHEPPVKKKAAKAKPTWDQVMAKKKREPRAYGPNEIFGDLDIINHPTFGLGFVSEMIGQDKIEVTFQHDKRILVHNRLKLSLQVVQRQREEADKARAEEKARADALKKERAKEKESRMAKAALRDLDDLPDLPDELGDEIPDADLDEADLDMVMPKMKSGGKPSRLSPKALAALDDEDEDAGDEEGGDDEKPQGKGRKAKAAAGDDEKPARGRAPRGEKAGKDKEAARPAAAKEPKEGAGKEAKEKPKAEKAAKADKPEKAEKADKPAKPAKAEKTDKPEKAEKAEKADKPEKARPERASKAPAKSEPAKSEPPKGARAPAKASTPSKAAAKPKTAKRT